MKQNKEKMKRNKFHVLMFIFRHIADLPTMRIVLKRRFTSQIFLPSQKKLQMIIRIAHYSFEMHNL